MNATLLATSCGCGQIPRVIPPTGPYDIAIALIVCFSVVGSIYLMCRAFSAEVATKKAP